MEHVGLRNIEFMLLMQVLIVNLSKQLVSMITNQHHEEW